MQQHLFKTLFLLFLIPIYLFGVEPVFNETPKDNLNENVKIEEKQESIKSVDDRLTEQLNIAKDVLKNINDEIYILDEFKNKDYDTRINYLQNRISINQREDNTLAIKRDEIELLQLKEQKIYDNTLKELIEAKKSFKDIKYFISVLDNNIQFIEKIVLITIKAYMNRKETVKIKFLKS